MSFVDFVSIAIQRASEATAHDEQGEYDTALGSYTQAIQTFMLAVKHERDPNRKTMLQVKTKELLDRAEKLKDYLNDQRRRAEPGAPIVPTQPGAAGTQKPGAGKPKGLDEDRDKLRAGLQESVVAERPKVRWEDVAGLQDAKKALRQAVVLPFKLPHLFTGKRVAWKGLLLYGPPGTGKTFLAKAAASQCDCTFFSISSSNLMSKWLGESERLVRNLFEMARECSPAIIFIDEVDSLCSTRDEAGGSDATHRVLTEFLAQMDGIGHDRDRHVLVLGATNLPWALDPAIRRRFQRRIYIPLPDALARRQMFTIHMGDHPHTLTEPQWQQLVAATECYSGDDLRNLCQAALMQAVAKVEDATHFRRVRGPSPLDPTALADDLLEPCPPDVPGAVAMGFEDLSPDDLKLIVPPPTTYEDFLLHLRSARSISPDQLKRFQEFTSGFGTEG